MGTGDSSCKKSRKPVEESIRKKVLETRNLLSRVQVNDDLHVLNALGQLQNPNYGAVSDETRTEDMEPVPEEKLESMEVMLWPEYVRDMNFETRETVVPDIVYKLGKRKFKVDKVEAKRTRRRNTTRVVRWYEKQPFDDPVLEAKRLRALKA